MINDPQQIDFTQSYTDPAGPQAQDPSSALLAQITSATSPTPAPAPAPATTQEPTQLETQPVGGATPIGTQSSTSTEAPAAPPVTPAPAAPASGTPHVSSTQVPGFDTTALLARLAPHGIKTIEELKTMDEAKLRKLSTDVIAFEQRQASMDRFFYKNPDGSYDFTKGPDGSPTGLDPTGKFIPPGAQQPTPAPSAPAPSAPAKPKPSDRKSSKGKIADRKGKPVARKGISGKSSYSPKVKAARPKPKPKPRSKPKAPVVRQATVSGRTAI